MGLTVVEGGTIKRNEDNSPNNKFYYSSNNKSNYWTYIVLQNLGKTFRLVVAGL
jgi:hypothetical protein